MGVLVDLVAHAETIPSDVTNFDLWVPENLTVDDSDIAHETAMALLLDKLLARNFPWPRRPT